jgi:predicted nuclease with TOPRIM domain
LVTYFKQEKKMTLTNAERQANFKKKREDLMQSLASQNEALLSDNARLQAEVKSLTDKVHRLEIAALKAQIKRG